MAAVKGRYDLSVKLLTIGDSGVGKSCIIQRFTEAKFDASYISTIGIDFKSKVVDIDDRKVKLQIWDTAGQERFRNITMAYYRGAAGILLCYDITDVSSFQSCRNWMGQIAQHASEGVDVVVVGNKMDCVGARQVTPEEGKEFADEYGRPFFEVSAKENTNIDDIFLALARSVVSRGNSVGDTANKDNSKQVNLNKKESVRLNTGAMMPTPGFGTFLSEPGQVGPAIDAALRAGYRHIDCAACYENEQEIGAEFAKWFDNKDSGVRREDVFVTSKLWLTEFHPSKVRAALQKTLADLRLAYLDLYLIHIPVICNRNEEGNSRAAKRAGFTLHDTWKVLEACYEEGLVKAIGVSNFPAVLLNELQNGCKIMPAVNQIERHPYLTQPENVAFNKDLGVVVTAYAPLGAPGLMGDEYKTVRSPLENAVILAIAAKYGKTPAQVLLRWSIDSGIVPLPKSINPSRIVENFNVFDFKLDAEDMAAVNNLNIGLRTFKQDWMGIPCFA